MPKLLETIQKTLKIGPYSAKAIAQREEQQRRERAKVERQKAKLLAQDSEDAQRVDALLTLVFPESELELKNVDVNNLAKMSERTVYHSSVWQQLAFHVVMLRTAVLPDKVLLKAQTAYQKQAVELIEQIRNTSAQKQLQVARLETGLCANISAKVHERLQEQTYIHPKFYEPMAPAPKEGYTPRKVGTLH